ncbi:MAG: cyclic pyranopterin monophosphate synthase MoaC [Deltaproteobacteria bacterium]|nr:cyclic pyranopterin monophosphate synthase MoaC [Deltaproteobacteria bacterium]
MSEFTHVDEFGHATMVDVSEKSITQRVAKARATVKTRPDVIDAISSGRLPKGDVLAVARVAGIMAAKKTHELIPLCHPLPIEQIEVNFNIKEDEIELQTNVKSSAKTGVEMEALTAAAVTALTIYDMCKSTDREMSITNIRVIEKDGGKSGHYIFKEENP